MIHLISKLNYILEPGGINRQLNMSQGPFAKAKIFLFIDDEKLTGKKRRMLLCFLQHMPLIKIFLRIQKKKKRINAFNSTIGSSVFRC